MTTTQPVIHLVASDLGQKFHREDQLGRQEEGQETLGAGAGKLLDPGSVESLGQPDILDLNKKSSKTKFSVRTARG